MSSPLIYKAVFGALGLFTSVGLPAGAAWFAHHRTGNALVAAVVAAAVIYQTMALSVAALSIWEYVPDSLPLGPSFMAGHGLLSLSFLLPVVVLPGLVWLWLLPVDEQGYVARGAAFGLRERHFETPHYEEVTRDD
ncbi:MAG: hypothetical protein HQRvContig03_3 [Haloquadratum phage sp.]|nr:MAG: hypothetical protein HQRvContig03_3 [Haloquadratum phage sp.]